MTRDGYEVQPVSTDAEPPLQRMSVGEKGLEIFAEGLANVSTIAQAGCFAAWLIAHAEGATQSELSIVVRKVVFEHCWKPQIIPKKGMIFPMRAGELEGFVRSLRHCSLEQALDPTFAESWKLQAWQLCARVGLNAVSGSLQPLAEGRLNAIQNRAAASLTKSCGRLLELKGVHPCTADSVEDELKGKRLSYTGEEVSTCHPLTLDQVLPGLPPAGHGGSVDVLSLLSSGTSRLLQDPSRLILPDTGQILPPLQARVHCSRDEILPLCRDLSLQRATRPFGTFWSGKTHIPSGRPESPSTDHELGTN